MTHRICFIGHRNVSFRAVRKSLKDVIEYEIKNGCKNFTMGTHGEFDKMALSVCRELRQIYKDIKIEVVLTSLNLIKKQIMHKDKFSTEYTEIYNDVSTIMYDIEDKYFKRQITISNYKMIDNCDTLICYVNESKINSGAKTAMSYAKNKGIRIINLFTKVEV